MGGNFFSVFIEGSIVFDSWPLTDSVAWEQDATRVIHASNIESPIKSPLQILLAIIIAVFLVFYDRP